MSSISRKLFPKRFQPISKKHNFLVFITSEHSIRAANTDWDGGSRSVYHYLNLCNGKLTDPNVRLHGSMFNPVEAPLLGLTQTVAVVESGSFMGKPATPAFMLHYSQLSLFLGCDPLATDTPPEIVYDYLEEHCPSESREVWSMIQKEVKRMCK